MPKKSKIDRMTHQQDLEVLMESFQTVLLRKAIKAEEKHGWNGAWQDTLTREGCIEHMMKHITKGDPRDVAIYCAFAWHHDWKVTPPGDMPELDATDGAHPAWWRGNDHGVDRVVEILTSILDGNDRGTFGYPPLQQLIDRIKALRDSKK